MKKFVTVYVFLCFSVIAIAEKVSPTEAFQAALPYIKSSSVSTSARQSRAGSAEQPVYIFSRGEGEGFVIVSGDNSLPLVLGVADTGDWVEEEMPPLLLTWVKMYEHYVDSVQQHGGAPARAARASVYPKNIPTLLTSHWHQSAPYNNRCPWRADGGGRAVTGCVATAAAQIAYYWRNEGVNSETQSATKYGYWSPDAPVTADNVIPKGTKFMWELMRDSYGSSNTSAERDAAAILCSVMGFDAELSYGSSTGGYIWNEIPVFENQIGLHGGTHLWKSDTNQTTFETICANDLAQGHPILYAGYNEDWSSGHAIVMDGYSTTNNSFHFNFGWGGQGDGYYQLIDGSVNGFGYGESVVYNIYSPNIERTYEIEPVEDEFYQYVPNHLNVKVANGSSMSINGAYLFACAQNTLPSTTTLDNALAFHEGKLSKGDVWETQAVYQPTMSSTNGVYFIITDENLSVLYTTETATKVLTSRANMQLDKLSMENDGFADETFNLGGDNVTRKVYNIESSADLSFTALMTNVKGRRAATRCMPNVQLVVNQVNYDGTLTLVASDMVDDVVFEAEEQKTLSFNISGLRRGMLYKASIYSKITNGNGTIETDLQYDTEQSDTVAFFRLAANGMVVSHEGNSVVIEGAGYASTDYAAAMSDATVTSYDFRYYNGTLPADAPLPANPNAVIFSKQETGLTGDNVVIDGVAESLVLTEGNDFAPAESFKAEKVTVKLSGQVCCTNDSYYWNTIVLPFTATVPYGMLARKFTGSTAKTEAHSETLVAGTPYIYLTTHHIDITATDVDVKCLGEMSVSEGDGAYIGTFSGIVSDGSQYVSAGTEFVLAAAGTEIPAMSAYRMDAVSLADMLTGRVDNRMHTLVYNIVEARNTLEEYTLQVASQHRAPKSEDVVAAFQDAIALAEQRLTLLDGSFTEVKEYADEIAAATETFKSDITGISQIDAVSSDGVYTEDSGVVYDLKGRRLSAVPEKGVYIIDGKKFVK